MISIEQIDHVVLRTSRVREMSAFYCDVLGCTVERTLSSEIGLTQLRAGQALIDLVDVDSQLGKAGGEAPGLSGRNLDHFCLQIAPVSEQELSRWLRQHGIEAGPFQTRYGADGFGPSVYITDPDGNTIELRVSGAGDRVSGPTAPDG
jgi:catechol 2,3-dioxygenase-like lactoylglutathione lyase family enzyme